MLPCTRQRDSRKIKVSVMGVTFFLKKQATGSQKLLQRSPKRGLQEAVWEACDAPKLITAQLYQ